MLELTPCLMMSPLSIAKFLSSNNSKFDLVVFDEASQIKPAMAFGAIVRAKNTIIVGDPKQMPPTSFFDKNYENVEDDDEGLESVLDIALGARLPIYRLTSHYRSRHESLIAFSNQVYYNNTLISYPSVDTRKSAVCLHLVEDGLYAKGSTRNNPKEAKTLVDTLVARLKKGEKQSFGVVTLNEQQAKLILDLLDEARRKYPEIESHCKDKVFVKNLESVQGHEADVIFLSLGYAPTELGTNTMSMNFGPLNKEGGERRLNVAVSRAKEEVVVFSSFSAAMIDESRTQALGVRHLKTYLQYAEKGPEALANITIFAYKDSCESPFEEAVALKLRDSGWTVHTQVGVSKYRIDLAIVHPKKPGEYLAGIECDGATYHSSPNARDRDRIRQGHLEAKGWKILRIWSTQYYNDEHMVMREIEAKLKNLLDLEKSVNSKK